MNLLRRRWRQVRWIAGEAGSGTRSFVTGFLRGFRIEKRCVYLTSLPQSR